MFATHSRKLLLAALLAATLAAPASASDGQPMAQMALMGQSSPDMVAIDSSATIVESSQMPTKASMPALRAPQKVTELRPSIASARQPGAVHLRPLILGIGY